MSAFGSRSATSEGRSRPPIRSEIVRLTGPRASTATHAARRPISSQVPSTSRPSGASRSCTSAQAAGTSSSAYCRSTLNARTTSGPGARLERDLEAAEPEAEAVALQRLAGGDPRRVDLDADDLDVGPHPPQPVVQLDGGDGRGAVAEVDDDGRRRGCAAAATPAGPRSTGRTGAAGSGSSSRASPCRRVAGGEARPQATRARPGSRYSTVTGDRGIPRTGVWLSQGTSRPSRSLQGRRDADGGRAETSGDDQRPHLAAGAAGHR